jgi:hypothetical protein
VGRIGEEVKANGGSLKLVNVNPDSGWKQRVVDEEPDEIEVRFAKGKTAWRFEAELDSGGLEVSRKRDTQSAGGGTYRVGDAAEVQSSSEGGSLSLDNVSTRDGWGVTRRDVSTGDVEAHFRNGKAAAEVGAEFGRGQIKLEVSQKAAG